MSPLDRWREDPDGTLGDLPTPEALDAALAKALAYGYLLSDGTAEAAEELVRNRVAALHTAPTDEEALGLIQDALDAGRAGFVARLRRQLAREPRRLALIGRDRKLADNVLGWAHRELATRGEHTAITETPDGGYFEVKVAGSGEPPTHVFTVTVELDRLEPLT